jgi:hypothetical protein
MYLSQACIEKEKLNIRRKDLSKLLEFTVRRLKEKVDIAPSLVIFCLKVAMSLLFSSHLPCIVVDARATQPNAAQRARAAELRLADISPR